MGLCKMGSESLALLTFWAVVESQMSGQHNGLMGEDVQRNFLMVFKSPSLGTSIIRGQCSAQGRCYKGTHLKWRCPPRKGHILNTHKISILKTS